MLESPLLPVSLSKFKTLDPISGLPEMLDIPQTCLKQLEIPFLSIPPPVNLLPCHKKF
jgi:hypothetical protein